MTDMLKLFSTTFTRREKSFLFSLISVSILILLMRFFFLGEFGLLPPLLLLLLEQVCRPLRKTFQLLLMIMSFLTFCILHWSPCDQAIKSLPIRRQFLCRLRTQLRPHRYESQSRKSHHGEVRKDGNFISAAVQ